jgi:hypothetical protein
MEETNKGTYTEKAKANIMKYRETHREEYNSFMRDYYEKKKTDEEWIEKHKERCRLANRRYRAKKSGCTEPKKRGRPRKILSITPPE